jgi:hypothetical protein
MNNNLIVCYECMKKTSVCTADFGGSFTCMICGELQKGVPSFGHGKVCHKCVRNGHCKYCGKILKKEMEK